MSEYKNIYLLIDTLYKKKRYKDVISKAERYLNLPMRDIEWYVKVKFMKASSFRNLGLFNEALKELNEILDIDRNNMYAKLELFYTCYYLKKYQEAIKLLPELYNSDNTINNHSLFIAEMIMKKELGMSISYRQGTRSDYIKEQIINYNESLALEHIKEHSHTSENKDNHRKYFGKFNDINFEYLMEVIKENLKKAKRTNTQEILDEYYFAVSNIGFDDRNILNNIKVIVVPNTLNIITMYPVLDVDPDYMNILSFDHDKLFKKNNNIKQDSRIDRFNRKFNR